jgi:hypothetical protein
MTTADLPIACSLSGPALAARRQDVIEPLFRGVQQVRDLPDGYGLAFPGEAEWLARLSAFVAFERECCPFFTFELVCEPNHGPIWLNLRGSEGVKALVAAELPLNALTPLQKEQAA